MTLSMTSSRRHAGLSQLVQITAIKSTNQHQTRFRVDWQDDNGETGHGFYTSVNTGYVYRQEN